MAESWFEFNEKSLQELTARAGNNTASTYATVSEFCKFYECEPFTPPKAAIVFKDILWVNFVTSALVTFVGITIMYRKWIKVKYVVEDWPYSMVVYGIPMWKLQRYVPERMITIGLFLKIVPSLVIDVIDILFDNIYYAQLVSSYENETILNRYIHIRFHVFVILFTFQITGTIKNIILVILAKRQLDRAHHATEELSESSLLDTNAYMLITFYQTILAFFMQDAPEALTQYFYVDKFLEEFNSFNTSACVIRFLMSCRVMVIFTMYVNRYIDPAYHTLRDRVLLWSLVGIKFIIWTAHGLRSAAVMFTTSSSETSFYCIKLEDDSRKLIQTPWSFDCMDGMDTTLGVLSALSFMGAITGLLVGWKYGEKVYNQSHYSGRTAATIKVRDTNAVNVRPGRNAVMRTMPPNLHIPSATEWSYEREPTHTIG